MKALSVNLTEIVRLDNLVKRIINYHFRSDLWSDLHARKINITVLLCVITERWLTNIIRFNTNPAWSRERQNRYIVPFDDLHRKST